MVVTELHDMPVVCRESEYSRFSAPGGSSCVEYAGEFLRQAPGYLRDGAADVCEYCPYKVGNEFYEPLGLSWDNRWRDLGIFAAFVGSTLAILFLASRFLNFAKR